MNAIIGRKLGMTRIYQDDGTVSPVTVVQAGPCPIIQVRDRGEGALSVQMGFGSRKPERETRAFKGHVAAAGVETVPAVLREFQLEGDFERPSPGDIVTVSSFESGDLVKVSGTTKGRGFQGVVKRHGFAGGPATHGNTRYRRPGSMGPGTDPSRVIKGKKLPGQHGATKHTELGITVVKVDEERNLLFLQGSVPGPKKGIVTIRKQTSRSRYA